MKRFLILLVLLPVAFATSYQASSLETMYTRANYVAFGTVENAERHSDRTVLTLHNHTVLQGDANVNELVWAGTKDIAGMSIPAAGDDVLVFAYTKTDARSPIVGFAQGLFTETNDRFVSTAGMYITITAEGELTLTSDSHAGSEAQLVREALAAPTFASEAEEPAPSEPGEPLAPARGEPREIVIAVSEPVFSEPAFTRALAAWNEALAGHAVIEASVSEEAAITIGDATELGDAVSVTYRDGGQLHSEVNTRSGQTAMFNAFLVEIGVHAGAQPEASPAVMAALPAHERKVTAADANAILARATHVLGDLNQDGVVDFSDLILLAAEHGQRGVNLPGDLNNDGVVDDADVAILKELYTFTAPAKP